MHKIINTLLATLIVASCGGDESEARDPTNQKPPRVEAPPLAASAVDYEPFARDEQLVQFLHPRHWRYHSDTTPEYIGGYKTGYEDEYDEVLEAFFVFQVSLKDFESDGDLQDITIIEEREVTVSGLSGIEVIFDAKVPDSDIVLRFLATEVFRNNTAYVFVYLAEPYIFPKYREIARHMTQTAAIGIDLAALDIHNTGDFPQKPKLLFDGEKHFLFYCKPQRVEEPPRTVDYSELAVLIISEQGEKLNDVTVTSRKKGQCPDHTFDVAFNGRYFTLVSALNAPDQTLYTKIYAIRISKSGETLDSSPILVSYEGDASTFDRSPSIAFNGTDYLVAWQGQGRYFFQQMGKDNTYNSAVFSALLSGDGKVSNRKILDLKEHRNFSSPKVVYRNGAFDAAWVNVIYEDEADRNVFYGRRVTHDGNFSDSPPIKLDDVTGTLYGWDLVSNGSSALLNIGVTVDHNFGYGVTHADNWHYRHYYDLNELANSSANTTSGLLWELRKSTKHVPEILALNGEFRLYYYEEKSLLYKHFDPASGELSPPSIFGTRWTDRGFQSHYVSSPVVSIGESDELLIFDRAGKIEGWLKSAFSNQPPGYDD